MYGIYADEFQIVGMFLIDFGYACITLSSIGGTVLFREARIVLFHVLCVHLRIIYLV